MRRGRRYRSVYTVIAACVGVVALAPVAIAAPPSSADLSVTISDSPDPAPEGTEVTYTITVSNAGPSAASGVSLSSTVQGGGTFVRGSASQGTCSGSAGSASCSLGSIAKRGTATATLVFKAGAYALTNTVSVSGAQVDNDTNNNEATASTTVTPDSSAETLSSCTTVTGTCRGDYFWIADYEAFRVSVKPSPGYTGTATVYIDGQYDWFADGNLALWARYQAGELVDGSDTAIRQLPEGTYVVSAQASRVPLGPVTVGPPSTCTPRVLLVPPLCTPGPLYVNGLSAPGVGWFTANVTR